MPEYETYHSWPDAGYRHIVLSLPFKIHGHAFSEDTHSDLPYSICRLPAEEPRIYRRTDHNDSSFPAIVLEMWEKSLDRGIESFWINALHELEAFEWCILNRRPPYRARVVDEYIDAAMDLLGVNNHLTRCIRRPNPDSLLDHSLNAFKISCIHRKSCGLPARLLDLPRDRAYRRLRRVGVRRKRAHCVGITGRLCSYDD
jgi:hypothetical protein